MRFVTIDAGHQEEWGVVLDHPATGEPWVFIPGQVVARLEQYAALPTSALRPSQVRFLSQPWPRTLTSLLTLGEEGMIATRRLQDFLRRFLEQADQALLAGAGHPLNAVQLRAPIPRPRLCFGLVDNKPKRNQLSRSILHIYPQGHQRPQGSIIGPGQPVIVTPEMGDFFWNPELGVIIGKPGRNIELDQAMEHVAGYTVVLDITHDLYLDQMKAQAGDDPLDFFEAATGSWLGKKSDTFCPMGPFLVTPDEVGNPYDLLITSRQSGWLRDRGHTSAMLVGIEHAIHYISSFMTLQPGDVIHMATMGVDGLPYSPDMSFGPEDTLEGEIEQVGALRVPVVMEARGDWRSPRDESRSIHPAPAVRGLLSGHGAALTGPEAWDPEQVRHVWTLFGNYADVQAREGFKRRRLPRIINAPGGVLGESGRPLMIPQRATGLSFGVELAFVIARIAREVSIEDAEDHILGYIALAVMHDQSHRRPVDIPASIQERWMPTVYARWADGSNVASLPPRPLPESALRGRAMRLELPGVAAIRSSTDEYVTMSTQTLAFLSQAITLFPGDVVTLGRVSQLIEVGSERPLAPGARLRAEIEGVGMVESPLVDQRCSGEAV